MYGLKMAPYFYLDRRKIRKSYGPIDLIVPNAYITERQHFFFLESLQTACNNQIPRYLGYLGRVTVHEAMPVCFR